MDPQVTAWIAAQDLLRSCPLPPAESRALLCHVLGVSRERLVAHPESPVTDTHRRRFEHAVAERLRGVPLAYLLGEQEFHGHRFQVTPAVLIPRPDTELLVDTALQLLAKQPGARVLEVGTGSGCIAIAMALARPDLWLLATDRSTEALRMAALNQARLGSGVHFVGADWYAPLRGTFDLIVGNPPYIARGDAHLPALAHEPLGALSDGGDGLGDLRALVAGAGALLAPGGRMLLEHGFDQGAQVRALLLQHDFAGVQTLHDLAGRERACLGCAVGSRPVASVEAGAA